MRDRILSLPELPASWLWTRLGEVCSNEKDKGTEGSVPYLEIGNIDISAKTYCAGAKPAVKGALLSREGDILISRVRPTRGAVVVTREEEILVSSALTILRPILEIPCEYIHYLLAWNSTFLDFLGENSTGTMYPTVKEDFILQYPVPLAPLPEQHRIVAKIEELFTKLDAGVEALNRIKLQLNQYRQAVLKHAFEGKLTKEWRESHKDEMEPASVLLEKIKAERAKIDKYKELSPVDTSDLLELPEGWVWTRARVISESIQYGTSEKATGDESGIPVLRMGNIKDGKLIFDNLKYFPKEWPQLEGYLLQDGDILFNRTNSAELVGKTAVYKSHHLAALFASYLIRVKVDKNAYSPDLLSFFINSFYGRRYIASVVSQQVGQANVNGTKLSLMPVPLPPLPEQNTIVEEIECCFSVADEIEKVVEQSLKQAERLRQSILKRAFEGKLVPQDPTDEPAEELLKRIRAERAKIEAEKKATGKTRRS